MMLRVVVYAEGPADDRGFEPWLPESGELLPTTALGPAHVLVARAVRAVDGSARREPGFVGPITLNGSPARGSMLLAKKTLRRLLTYASPLRRPDLAIVLVDEDGSTTGGARFWSTRTTLTSSGSSPCRFVSSKLG